MYAAAGGASLASRRADKKKALQQKKNESQQKLLREKMAQAKVSSSLETPTKSKGFHQLPANYLRPPQGVGRKLSATYTGVQGSRCLLPINEGSFTDELKSPSTGGAHLLGFGTSGLHRSQTATIPFMFQQDASGVSPPATPNVCFPTERPPFTAFTYTNDPIDKPNLTLTIPGQDPIIITPATPIPTPLHPNLLPTSSTAAYQLERKCSVHRRKLDTFEEQFYRTTNYQTAQELYNEEFRAYLAAHQSVFLPNGGQRQPWEEPWCLDPEHQQQGICTCDHLEVL
uniref:CSON000787 protein n=1 Tax=Culicoides sonorensis TaxID=179676 RepID=A0A336MGG5_CULSO